MRRLPDDLAAHHLMTSPPHLRSVPLTWLSPFGFRGFLIMSNHSIRLSNPVEAVSRSKPRLASPARTDPPGKFVLLYDGSCRFCTAQSRNLAALARRGAVEAVNFQTAGVLERFPGISHEACMQSMHLVTPDGRIYKGFEAAVRAVATRPVFGWIAYAYYLPGLRQVIDWFYSFIASRRYRLFRRSGATTECESGTCKLHGW